MASDQIAVWLKRKRRLGIGAALGYATITIFGGLVVMGLMICVNFVVAKLILLSAFPLHAFLATFVSALAAVIINGFIFFDSIRARRDDMTFLPSWLLREYISIGPRLILEGWPQVLRVRRFSQMDIHHSAKVLAYLAGKAIPASHGELLQKFPETDWSRLTADLGLLSGVIFFRPDGLRVSLTTPLRLELRALLANQPDENVPAPEPLPVEEPHQLTPAEILGVPTHGVFGANQNRVSQSNQGMSPGPLRRHG